MDRRRFAFRPSAESLDARLLLSTTSSLLGTSANNLQTKTLRISRLPYYLEQDQPGRVLPDQVVTALQGDIRAVVGSLQRPPSADLVADNDLYRSSIATGSLSVEDASGLSSTFTQTLQDTGMPAQDVANFRRDMNALAASDSAGRDPGQLAAADYSLILQTTLGVGRPIQTPAAPSLNSADAIKGTGGHLTLVTRPQLIGKYNTDTTVQLINDADGSVLGTSPVAANGEYSVAPDAPLAPGKYHLSIRAEDPNGDFSAPSRPFVLVIRAPLTHARPAGK